MRSLPVKKNKLDQLQCTIWLIKIVYEIAYNECCFYISFDNFYRYERLSQEYHYYASGE